MKKLLFLFSLPFSLLQFNANAQTCTPDESLTELINPNNNDSVQEAIAGEYYEEVFYLSIPADTTIDGIGQADINYVDVLDVVGLPDGFSFNCTPNDCRFPAESKGCFIVFGNIHPDSAGVTYQIIVELNVNATGDLFGNPITGNQQYEFPYEIKVKDDVITSTNAVNNESSINLFPNPTSYQAFLEINSEESGNLEISVVNLLGSRVFNENIGDFNGYYNKTFSKSNLGSGLFFVTINLNGKETIKKLIIN